MPPEARKSQQGGICLISIIVNTAGLPTDPQIVRCTDPIFAKNSMDAVMKYRFKPAMRVANKTPVPVRISIEINFRFGNGPAFPVEPPTQIRYAFSSPPGVTSLGPDGEGIYPLSKLLEAPRMTEFVSKGFGMAAIPFPDGTGCQLLLTLSQKGKPVNAQVTACDKPKLEKPAVDSSIRSYDGSPCI